MWSAHELKEGAGLSYHLQNSGRGKCYVGGICECLPPWRGEQCELLDEAEQEKTREYKAVLHYLTSDFDDDIADMVQSLPRLWKRYNYKHDYPVVVFHDGLSTKHRNEIVDASPNRTLGFSFLIVHVTDSTKNSDISASMCRPLINAQSSVAHVKDGSPNRPH